LTVARNIFRRKTSCKTPKKSKPGGELRFKKKTVRRVQGMFGVVKRSTAPRDFVGFRRNLEIERSLISGTRGGGSGVVSGKGLSSGQRRKTAARRRR